MLFAVGLEPVQAACVGCHIMYINVEDSALKLATCTMTNLGQLLPCPDCGAFQAAPPTRDKIRIATLAFPRNLDHSDLSSTTVIAGGTQLPSPMASPFPYTHYACPCTEVAHEASPKRNSTTTGTLSAEERTFNPHDPRANHSLYPLDHLLYCDECDGIRCPKCVIEEVINWYCPTCLFEVPSSAVRGDGNR